MIEVNPDMHAGMNYFRNVTTSSAYPGPAAVTSRGAKRNRTRCNVSFFRNINFDSTLETHPLTETRLSFIRPSIWIHVFLSLLKNDCDGADAPGWRARRSERVKCPFEHGLNCGRPQ